MAAQLAAGVGIVPHGLKGLAGDTGHPWGCSWAPEGQGQPEGSFQKDKMGN